MRLRESSSRRAAGPVLALVLAALAGHGCREENPNPPLSDLRLFLVDDANQWILDLNPRKEILMNFFPPPTPRISSSGCGLAYDSGSSVLYFVDPSDPTNIHRILPDESGPGQVQSLPLPTSAAFLYDGLGFDSNYLLGLDSQRNFIDAMDPGTGVIMESTAYCVDPLDVGNCVDLSGGLDATLSRGIYAVALDGITGEKVIHRLDSEGGVINTFRFEPTFDPQGIAVASIYVFASDLSTRKIRIFRIGRQDGGPALLPLKEIDFPPGANVTALAAGRR